IELGEHGSKRLRVNVADVPVANDLDEVLDARGRGSEAALVDREVLDSLECDSERIGELALCGPQDDGGRLTHIGCAREPLRESPRGAALERVRLERTLGEADFAIRRPAKLPELARRALMVALTALAEADVEDREPVKEGRPRAIEEGPLLRLREA